MRPIIVLAAVTLFAVVQTAHASNSDEKKFKAKCPGGTEAFGAPPPNGKQIWCRQAVPGGFIRQGNYTAFNRNGSKRVDGLFINNKKNGKWVTYDRFGNKVRETVYQDDKEVGETRYDSKGKPIAEAARTNSHDKKKQKANLTDWSGGANGNRRVPR